jgi:hypothetical protein
VALVAPLLFAYQAASHVFIGINHFLSRTIFTPIQYKRDFKNSFNFTKSSLSALLEIPEKLFYGPKSSANYLKISDRYDFGKLKFDLYFDSIDILGIRENVII